MSKPNVLSDWRINRIDHSGSLYADRNDKRFENSILGSSGPVMAGPEITKPSEHY